MNISEQISVVMSLLSDPVMKYQPTRRTGLNCVLQTLHNLQTKDLSSDMTRHEYYMAHAPLTLADVPKTRAGDGGTTVALSFSEQLHWLGWARAAYADMMIAVPKR